MEKTELDALIENLRTHWIEQVQDTSNLLDEDKCCHVLGVAAADALEAQAQRIAELEAANAALLKANLDCVAHYDELRKELEAIKAQEPVGYQYQHPISETWCNFKDKNEYETYKHRVLYPERAIFAAPVAPAQPLQRITDADIAGENQAFTDAKQLTPEQISKVLATLEFTCTRIHKLAPHQAGEGDAVLYQFASVVEAISIMKGAQP